MTETPSISRSPRRRRRLWIAGLAVLLGGLWYLLTDFYPEEEKQLRSQLRETVKESFPEESAAFSRAFGLGRFEPEGHPCREADSGRDSVVLVVL